MHTSQTARTMSCEGVCHIVPSPLVGEGTLEAPTFPTSAACPRARFRRCEHALALSRGRTEGGIRSSDVSSRLLRISASYQIRCNEKEGQYAQEPDLKSQAASTERRLLSCHDGRGDRTAGVHLRNDGKAFGRQHRGHWRYHRADETSVRKLEKRGRGRGRNPRRHLPRRCLCPQHGALRGYP